MILCLHLEALSPIDDRYRLDLALVSRRGMVYIIKSNCAASFLDTCLSEQRRWIHAGTSTIHRYPESGCFQTLTEPSALAVIIAPSSVG